MLKRVLVDSLDIYRKDEISFHYVVGDVRPEVYDYECFVNDFFQTINGDIFLDVTITHIGGNPYCNTYRLFNTKYIVRGTLRKIL